MFPPLFLTTGIVSNDLGYVAVKSYPVLVLFGNYLLLSLYKIRVAFDESDPGKQKLY